MARTAAVGAPLRHPAFQRLWLGMSISYLGDQFTIIALLWFVLQLTGSGAAVGLVILCFDLPGVFTGAILGRLLDRYQPRLVMGFDIRRRAWAKFHLYGNGVCRPLIGDEAILQNRDSASWPSILIRRLDVIELQKPPAPMRCMPPLTSRMCLTHLH